MSNKSNFPPESVWPMLGEWYDVTEASTNYANLNDAQNTLRVGQENLYGRVITRYHLAGPVR